MSQPKSKHTSMIDVKLRKANKKLEATTQENSQLRMSILNLRQMFESSVGEKQALQQQIQNNNQLLLAAVLQSRGKRLTITEKTLSVMDKWAGIKTETGEKGALVLTAVSNKEFEEQQDTEEVDNAS